MKKFNFFFTLFIALTASFIESQACTNILVSKGASKDGSVMISYNADAGGFMEPLYYSPAKDWAPTDSISIYEWDTGKYLGKIKQVAHTYKVIGNMNEFQVAIGETTFGGREELMDPNAIIDYGSLIYIALQRSKTAREAIKVMTDLVAEYGYASSGESFSVSDANEVWIMEMISKGKGKKGAVWAARRVPEGYICAHANQARIRDIPLNDKNTLYASDIFSFAESQGFWDSKSGKPFSFVDAYCPLDPGSLLFCEGRVWSIFRRAAPSQNFPVDYWRAVKGAEPYPLFIKADKLLGIEDMISLNRDHFEGTDYDMTKGLAAGPFGNPYRWKPLGWKVEGDTITKYAFERPISTQQTAFTFVTQSRSTLPDAIGGVFWYGLDDTYSSCYMPLYMGMNDIPWAYKNADVTKFSWESPIWVFNLVSNYAYGKYSYIIKDIQVVQKELEGKFLALQPAIEKTALDLSKTNPSLATQYITDYSVSQANMVFARWKKLGESIFTKYNDGYINDGKDGGRHPKGVGYGKDFSKRLIEDNPDYYKERWIEPKK